jgi:hypothetical protein
MTALCCRQVCVALHAADVPAVDARQTYHNDRSSAPIEFIGTCDCDGQQEFVLLDCAVQHDGR